MAEKKGGKKSRFAKSLGSADIVRVNRIIRNWEKVGIRDKE
jgi:hypothetical protein